MYSFEGRVRYSEVDGRRRMTLPSILDYLQDCCTFQSEALGIGLDYLEREHEAWILSSWQVEVLRYPRMGERIKVCTWPYSFKDFFGYRNFSIEDDKGDMVVKANSVWVFMDMESMRPARIPGKVAKAYEGVMGEPLPGKWEGRKLPVHGAGIPQSPVQVAKRDIDTNRHMNNGKYVQIAEEYLPEGFVPVGLRAEYRKAALRGDMLFPSVLEEEETVTVVLADGEGKPYAALRFEGGKESL